MSAVPLVSSFVSPLTKLPRLASVFLSILLLLIAVVIDWITGPEIAISIIYTAPIVLMTWKGGRIPGLAMAASCGGVWLSVELMTNSTYTNPLIPFWNAVVRTSVFCLVWGLTAEIVR